MSTEIPIVQMYTRPNCCLCTEAKERLRQVQMEWPFRLEEIDISTDPDLEVCYGSLIPLVKVAGEEVCRYRINKKRLKRYLGEIGGR